MREAEGLRRRLEALPLEIEHLSVRLLAVTLPSYPGGERPSSLVSLGGGGLFGCGEHVGWSEADHRRFAIATTKLPLGRCTLGEWCALLAGLDRYDRAALEAAAIDLALQQHGANLFELSGRQASPVRYVVSFGRSRDPVAEARAAAPSLEWKIDVDPDWPRSVWEALAASGQVAVLDFKQLGQPSEVQRAAELLPQAWIEDPPLGARTLATKVAADIDVTSVEVLESMQPLPGAVNVKAPRLGGVLEAIDCLERCRQLGLDCYLGGMFETGVARRQSLLLASIFSPDGPNDIAPLAPLAADSAPAPRLVADTRAAGFGR